MLLIVLFYRKYYINISKKYVKYAIYTKYTYILINIYEIFIKYMIFKYIEKCLIKIMLIKYWIIDIIKLNY